MNDSIRESLLKNQMTVIPISVCSQYLYDLCMARVGGLHGSTRLFIYQHVGIGNTNRSHWGLDPMRNPMQVVLRCSGIEPLHFIEKYGCVIIRKIY